MKESKRELPDHLTENIPSKCFVFRHPNLSNRKTVPFSYTRGGDREAAKAKAIAFAMKMNVALGPVPPKSVEGRMSSRNNSGIVRVNAKRDLKRGRFYYCWNVRWKGCPQPGGVSWPCLTHTDDGAYVLAALTLKMRTISRPRVIEEYERIRGTPKAKEILLLRPKVPIEELWPD
jgi:hypothetical protein